MTSQFSKILRGWSVVRASMNSRWITGSLHHDYFTVNQSGRAGYLVGPAINDGGPRHLAEKSCAYDGTIYHAKLRAWFAWFGHGRDPAEWCAN